MIIQRFNLNLIPNQSPVVVHVNQYDTGTGRLIATLYEGNEPYSPNGTAVIQGTKPDGHGFQYTATLDGNVVTADLTEQMAPVAGDVRTQIVVTESSGVTGTFAFIIRVQPSALPSDTDMSESDYQYIEEAIREAQEAVQTAQEATETAQEAVERAQEAIAETQENAEDSEAWAQGTRGGIPVEPTDPTYEHNAEYWAQYAERYAQGGLHYKASIPFVDIPTTGMREGDMYDITDDFTTDSRFTEGAGIEVKGGTNIAWNSDNKWDILALPYIPKTTFNGRSGSILPMAGDYDSDKILLSSILHIGGETQSDVQEALEALSDDGVKSFNGRSGSILPIAGDYDSEKILLASVLHIGGETQENAQEALEALSNDGVKSFNGRSGSVLPIAGDYSAEQVNYDSNQTVKEKIDALVTKEASDIAGQQSLLKDTVGWTGKNLLKNTATSQTINGVTFTVNADKSVTVNGTATNNSVLTLHSYSVSEFNEINVETLILNGCPTGGAGGTYRLDVISNTETTKNLEDIGSGITVPANWFSEGIISVRLRIGNGTTVNNLTFYPMLCKADITDPTYEPYHESVETMYEEEIHGVNLFSNSISGLATSGGTIGTTNFALVEGATAFYGKVQRNKNYTITKAGGDRFRVCLSNEVPANRVPCNIIANADGNSYTFNSGNYDYVYLLASMTSQTIDVIKPMLRKADIDDSTYRPYNYQAIQNQLNAQGVLGAKNKFVYPWATKSATLGGITFTDNDGYSLTVNGTATSNTQFDFFNASNRMGGLETGRKYILSGAPETSLNTNDAKLQLTFRDSNDTASSQITVVCPQGGEIEFTIPEGYRPWYFVYFVRSGVTINNLVVKPMLRLASDPDDTYQPYAMTNRELTEALPFRFGIDSNGNYGYYKAGADTVTPFKTGGGIEFVAHVESASKSGTTIDVSQYPDATVDNFILVPVPGGYEYLNYGTNWGGYSGYIGGGCKITKSLSNSVLTVISFYCITRAIAISGSIDNPYYVSGLPVDVYYINDTTVLHQN